MSVAPLFVPNYQYTDQNGNPIPFAKVFSYLATTTTPAALYADPLGAIALPNPVTTDGGGRLTAYALVGQALKINVLDAGSVQVPGWPVDNLKIQPLDDLALMDDLSNTTSEASISINPGEPATPNLATSAADEIYQLRFRIMEMTGGADWRQTYVSRMVQGLTITPNTPTNAINVFPPTTTTGQQQTFVIPFGWEPQTNMTWVLGRRSTGGTGVAIMRYTVFRERNGQSFANIVTTTAANFVPSGSIMAQITLGIPGSGLLAGDIVGMTLERLGDDPSDTDGGNIVAVANYVIYSGVGSR